MVGGSRVGGTGVAVSPHLHRDREDGSARDGGAFLRAKRLFGRDILFRNRLISEFLQRSVRFLETLVREAEVGLRKTRV